MAKKKTDTARTRTKNKTIAKTKSKPTAKAGAKTSKAVAKRKSPRRVVQPRRAPKPRVPLGVLGVEAAALAPAQFQADVNGFGFVNSWTFTDAETKRLQKALNDAVAVVLTVSPGMMVGLLAVGLPQLLGNIVSKSVPKNYGLCGGMAFSALDYYLDSLPVPPGKHQPTFDDANGKKLRNYLVKRQIDSLNLNLPKILFWIGMLHFVPSTP